MSKPFTFRPPKNNRLVIGLAKWLMPSLMPLISKVVAIDVKEEDLGRLRKLKEQRAVLTPNHAKGVEPVMIFWLSRLLGEEFNYLAAKEAFEQAPSAVRFLQWLGVYPWLLQQLGAYSIVRGTADRPSFQMTRRLLVDGKRWLVIFPEGEVCWQGDTVMPFQQGVAQLAFWAYEDLARRGDLPPLYLVPMAIKYAYLKDMGPEIDASLNRLEAKLFPTPSPQPLAPYDRLRRVGETVLGTIEKEYNVRPEKEATLDQRLQDMKELIVSRVATALGAPLHPGKPLVERIRCLFATIDQIIYREPTGSEYERQLHQHRQQQAQELYGDLWRVLHVVALYDGYVRETLSAERFLDVLGRLELEVFGQERLWGPKKALVKIGEPLNLANYFACYKTNKQDALQQATGDLECSVQHMLRQLGKTVMLAG